MLYCVISIQRHSCRDAGVSHSYRSPLNAGQGHGDSSVKQHKRYIGDTLLRTVMLLLCLPALVASESIALYLSCPTDIPDDVRLAVTSGLPLPQGAVRELSQLRLETPDGSVPAQLRQTAVWPDGSVKWILIDVQISKAEARGLRLHYGKDITGGVDSDGLVLVEEQGALVVSGGVLSASLNKQTAALAINADGVQTVIHPVLEALRLTGPSALSAGQRLVHAGQAAAHSGRVSVSTCRVEDQGPLRVRLLLRGYMRLPQWGTTLPPEVLQQEPAEQVPFSLRYTVYRDLPLIDIDQKIIFSGEPDKDMISRWGFDLDGQGAGVQRQVTAHGLTIDRRDGNATRVDGDEARCCWVPLKDGLAFIRDGWYERPVQLGGVSGQTAQIDFWPRQAGPWDLRRYAREWATGESGNRESSEDMEFFARYAARGMAKSQRAGLYVGEVQDAQRSRALVRAYDRRSLLMAAPSWYAQTGVFGHYAGSVSDSTYARLENGLKRYLDYNIFNQDVYQWHGKLAYGFWQSRNGKLHRNDRWDRDYGRWGWALGDGAGRQGHALLIQFLRYQDRNYLAAGEAFCRNVYDTSMVHTKTYMENAGNNWWQVSGCNHRHNVQPFGCPYVGLRGSYPYGNRMLYLLTGDGVTADGLERVTAAAVNKISGNIGQALGNSGGSDGMGSACLALLHAYEKSGDKQYLKYCRQYFDRSRLFGEEAVGAGYSHSFGLFIAAAEYLNLANDAEFEKMFLAVARRNLADKEKQWTKYVTTFAQAWHMTQDDRYRAAIKKVLDTIEYEGSLAELPRSAWPGHGGARTAPHRANAIRDLLYGLAAIENKTVPNDDSQLQKITARKHVNIRAAIPEDWRLLHHQQIASKPQAQAMEASPTMQSQDGRIELGNVVWNIQDNEIQGRVRDILLASGMQPFVCRLETDDQGNRYQGAEQQLPMTVTCAKQAFAAFASNAQHKVRLQGRATDINGHQGLHMEAVFEGSSALAACGLRIPFNLEAGGSDIHCCAPGAFRVEHWRLDQNDEQIPDWKNSDNRTRWPLWRINGMMSGSHGDYRIFKANRSDTSPLFVDEGVSQMHWFDVRHAGQVGCTVHLSDLPQPGVQVSMAYHVDESALMIYLVPAMGKPFDGRPVRMAIDVIMHDGWQPPLLAHTLNQKQLLMLLDDLDYAENIGLFAYRFALSKTHKVEGDKWKHKIAHSGLRASQLLLSMEYRDGLKRFCEKIGVDYMQSSPEKTIVSIIEHYRR